MIKAAVAAKKRKSRQKKKRKKRPGLRLNAYIKKIFIKQLKKQKGRGRMRKKGKH